MGLIMKVCVQWNPFGKISPRAGLKPGIARSVSQHITQGDTRALEWLDRNGMEWQQSLQLRMVLLQKRICSLWEQILSVRVPS